MILKRLQALIKMGQIPKFDYSVPVLSKINSYSWGGGGVTRRQRGFCKALQNRVWTLSIYLRLGHGMPPCCPTLQTFLTALVSLLFASFQC